jgi:nicotinamide N-methyltransferase
MDLSSPTSLVTPSILCFYSHHRPTQELIAADLGFLTMAKAKGFKVQRVWKDQGAGVSTSHFFSRHVLIKCVACFPGG